MERVAQQFMRAIRGSRSQGAFARRLGYRANPITDWEHGRRYPTAQEALRAASLAKVDVADVFARFSPNIPIHADRLQGIDLAAWLRELCKATPAREVAARSGLSRFAIGRWLSGDRKPRLPDFLRLVDGVTARLPDLIAALVPIEQIPALIERYTAEQAARRIAYEQPWSEAILRVLETPAYQALPRHRTSWIAERLGIPRKQAADTLDRLQAAQVVTRRNGRYAELRPLHVDTRGGKHALYAIKQHWAQVAAERAPTPADDDLFAYTVFSASRDDVERIRGLLHDVYREVRSIVAASQPSEQVMLLNVHLLGWNQPTL